MNKVLILHIPVIHKGFLDFLRKNKDKASNVFIIDQELIEAKPDIASLDANTAKDLLGKLGFKNIFILSKNNIEEVRGREIILIQDEISRHLADKYFKGEEIAWQSVFLRWDREAVLMQKPLGDMPVSSSPFDAAMMREASQESQKSSDWWRQIGAVLVKDGKIILRGYNRDLPSDHTPYQVGEVRDFMKTGERQDLASTIHAEQNIVAQAAKAGISLSGGSIYVTTFPCPVCAKLIACSGIKNLYFGEGGSNFDARTVLESAQVSITCVPLKSV